MASLSAYELSEAIPALVSVLQTISLVNWGASGKEGSFSHSGLITWSDDHMRNLRDELYQLCRAYCAMPLSDTESETRDWVLANATVFVSRKAGFTVDVKITVQS